MKLRYCDGGSFMGDSAVYINSVCLLFGALVHILFAALDRSTSLPFGICQSWQSSVLYFSGQRIWDAIVADLLRKGLARADKVPRQFSLQPVTPVPPLALFSIYIISCFDLAWASALRIPGSALRLFGRRPSYVLPLRRP